jgi:uncharacterized protein (DUF433 family)
MKAPTGKKLAHRVQSLGKHVVRDSGICHGKPTFRGTRVMVADALEMLADGLTPEQICTAYGNWFPTDAVREAVLLACDSLNGAGRTHPARRLAAAA